jgi:hypothetical protein
MNHKRKFKQMILRMSHEKEFKQMISMMNIEKKYKRNHKMSEYMMRNKMKKQRVFA